MPRVDDRLFQKKSKDSSNWSSEQFKVAKPTTGQRRPWRGLVDDAHVTTVLNRKILNSLPGASSQIFFEDTDISLLADHFSASQNIDKIIEVLESIKEHGVMTPISLKLLRGSLENSTDIKIVLVDGYSRLEAIRLLRRAGNPRHLLTIKLPCVVILENED